MKKILIIDDEESILEALKLTLEMNGYEVRTGDKGGDVFKNLEDFKPELVLLDILLPDADGRQICRQIKTNKETKAIKVIMISAHPTAEKTINRYFADGFLPKPFDIEVLLKTMEENLN